MKEKWIVLKVNWWGDDFLDEKNTNLRGGA